jgi:hypothetical protein
MAVTKLRVDYGTISTISGLSLRSLSTIQRETVFVTLIPDDEGRAKSFGRS